MSKLNRKVPFPSSLTRLWKLTSPWAVGVHSSWSSFQLMAQDLHYPFPFAPPHGASRNMAACFLRKQRVPTSRVLARWKSEPLESTHGGAIPTLCHTLLARNKPPRPTYTQREGIPREWIPGGEDNQKPCQKHMVLARQLYGTDVTITLCVSQMAETKTQVK